MAPSIEILGIVVVNHQCIKVANLVKGNLTRMILPLTLRHLANTHHMTIAMQLPLSSKEEDLQMLMSIVELVNHSLVAHQDQDQQAHVQQTWAQLIQTPGAVWGHVAPRRSVLCPCPGRQAGSSSTASASSLTSRVQRTAESSTG